METDADDDDDKPEITIDADPTKPPTADTNTALLPSILPPLLALIQPTPLSFPPLTQLTSSAAPLEDQPKSTQHAPTTSALASVHISALECLNNVFLSLSVGSGKGANANVEIARDVDAGTRVWDGVWTALALVGLEGVGVAGQERRKEFWEIAAGVLWGVGGIWKGSIVSRGRK